MSHSLDKWAENGEVEERLLPPSKGRFLPYLATLASAGIPHHTESSGDGQWYIVVSEEHAAEARQELVAYEEANASWPGWAQGERSVRSARPGAVLGTTAAVAGLLLFFVRIGPAERGGRLFEAGSLDTTLVLQGAWWRTITALTLHADVSHVAGNALCAGVFGYACCQLVGSGPAWLMILVSGILGNATEVLVAGGGRSAIGASTATFGALGALGVLQTVRYRRHWPGYRMVFSRTWLPITAAAALLQWLGTSPRADLLGHGFGFAWGMILAGFCVPLLIRDIPWYWHLLLGLVAAGLIASAWHVALV